MNPQSTFDLAPLTRVMLAGIVIAVGPLLWVWWRNRGASPIKRLHAVTVITLFLTFDLVVFGAFTRLSDSGLGCPDWPGCYGSASPLGAAIEISSAQSSLPSGPVTHSKAWIEMIHRYLATGVGVLILVVAVGRWRLHRAATVQGEAMAVGRDAAPWLATGTLVWVCVQGAFGALTVTMKLFPAIVTLHLLGGMVLLALLCWQVVQQALVDSGARVVSLSWGLRALLWATLAALTLQIALGGWVSTNYAVLACTDFPTCQGRWWPDMNFAQGFEVWRPLGKTSEGSHISFSALTAIHMVHRMMAAMLLALAGALAWQLNRVSSMRAMSRWVAALIGLQVATGLSNVVFEWPLLAALLHTAGAGALVIVLVWTLGLCAYGARTASAPRPAHLQKVATLSV